MDSVTRCPTRSVKEEHDCGNCKYWETPTVEIDTMNKHFIVHSEPCRSCFRGNLLKERDKYEDKWEPKPKQKTALEIIEEVKNDICDKVCKYREQYDYDTLLEEYCETCPLERLA